MDADNTCKQSYYIDGVNGSNRERNDAFTLQEKALTDWIVCSQHSSFPDLKSVNDLGCQRACGQEEERASAVARGDAALSFAQLKSPARLPI